MAMARIASLLKRSHGSDDDSLVGRVTTADYFLLMSRAMDSLPDASPERRAEFYRSVRNALTSQLKAMNPPISKARIKAEQRALDDAVESIEARAASTDGTETEPDMDSELTLFAAPATVPDISISTSEHDNMPQRQLHSMFSPRVVEEKPMSRLDEMNRVLRKLQSDSFGVEACALISEDGLMIASVLAADMEETRVAGMTATLLSLGGRAAMELGRSHLQEVIIRGESGYAVLVSAGRGALLLALTNESSKLGLTFFDMREAVRALQKVL
jgi:predicted regulator of Ras-like GTPase activity (Roadblock/LC7/MglB family)